MNDSLNTKKQGEAMSLLTAYQQYLITKKAQTSFNQSMSGGVFQHK